MKKKNISLLLIPLFVLSGCFQQQPQQTEVKPPEKPISFDQPTPTNEASIAYYTENDTFATLAGASPYYMGNQPSELPGLLQYETLKQQKVQEAITLTDNLIQACKDLKTQLEPYKGAFYDFVGTAQENEDKLKKYAAESSGQILEYLVTEGALIVNYESIDPDKVVQPLTKTMLQYQKTMLAMQLGETMINDITYLLASTSALYNAFESTTNPSIKDQLSLFQKELEKIERVNPFVDKVVNTQLNLAIVLKQIETGDYYMGQATLEFMQQSLPNIKSEMEKITPNDTITSENIEAINEYEGVIETFIENMGTNTEGIDTSSLLTIELPSSNGTTTSWGIDKSMAAYAPSESQKLLGAYKSLQNTPPPEQLPSTWSKIGSALKSGASFTWSGIKSGFSKAQTGVGVTLDTIGAGTKSIFDAGFGLANGNSVSEVTSEIAGNFKKVGDNYNKGTSGSQILKDAGGMLKGAEEAAGSAAEGGVEYVVGKGWTSWAVGGITKTTVGMFTGFGKGMYKIANKQSSTGELVEGMLDVGLSLIGGSKVIVKGSQVLTGGKEMAKWSAEKAFTFLKMMGNKLEQGELKAMTAEILKNSKLTANQVLSLISNSLEMEGKEAIAVELKAISSEMNSRFAALLKDGLKTIATNIKTVPGTTYEKWVQTAFEDSIKGFKDAMIARLGNNYKDYIDNLVAAQMNKLIKTAVKEWVDAQTAPLLKDLAGKWDSGSMVITDVIVSDEFRKEAEKEGCNIADIEAQKGKTQPLNMSLNPTSETGGNMVITSADGKDQTIPFTYSEGVIKASISQEGATMSVTMTVVKETDTFKAGGPIIINFKGDSLKIIASGSASKAAPPPLEPPSEEDQ